MCKRYLLPFNLVFSLFLGAQELPVINYIEVDTPLRNQTLIDLVVDDLQSHVYYEDDGIESRISKISSGPKITLLGKIDRRAVELWILTDLEVGNFFAGTDRPAPPYRHRSYWCETSMKKDDLGSWKIVDSFCEETTIWDT